MTWPKCGHTLTPQRPLTPAQSQVLSVIVKRVKAFGYPPTYQELADVVCLSKVTIAGHVRELEVKGYVSTTKFKARSIVVI